MTARRDLVLQWTLTGIAVAGLLIDAYVHFHLASAFAQVKTSTVSEATLFRAEATAAVIAAIALVVRPGRVTSAFACLVAGAGTVAVLLYRYVDVGGFGPIPNMYDPYWAPTQKTVSVFAEAVAAVAALILFLRFTARARRSSETTVEQRA